MHTVNTKRCTTVARTHGKCSDPGMCLSHVITDTSDLINWAQEQDVTAHFLFGYSDLL